MVLVKVLERKDAASLVVAIAGGLVLGFMVMQVATSLSDWLLNVNDMGFRFKNDVLAPVLTLLVAALLLEGLARLAIAVRSNMGNR